MSRKDVGDDLCHLEPLPRFDFRPVIANGSFTSTPVIFDAEPIVRFSLLGRRRSISGSTPGRFVPGRLNSPINTPRTELSASPAEPELRRELESNSRISPQCPLRRINAPATSKEAEKAHGGASGRAGGRSARPFLSEAQIWS